MLFFSCHNELNFVNLIINNIHYINIELVIIISDAFTLSFLPISFFCQFFQYFLKYLKLEGYLVLSQVKLL